ncbi:hypothetical protein MW887_008590 [Aspergillus wentii]|nr:hypothetical protein MW887_008590 [Aspergillus wentii]
MPGGRPGFRIMPRTSSIDSAISSLSSASQPHKSTFDANALSQADIANLIATAGSAESVIVHLLKEKHHAASQNSQLWRLVDKQRALILGLNKDLERALKEKERYKKKMKELQNSVPPVPSVDDQIFPPQAGESSDIRHDRESPNQIQPQNQPKPQHSSRVVEKSLRIETRSTPSAAGSQNSAENDSPIDPRKDCSQATPRDDLENPQSMSYTTHDPLAASPKSFTSSKSTGNDPLSGEGKQSRSLHQIRKAPPAPLNLEKQPHRTAAQNTAVYDSDSEYEDVLAVEEVSIERGRRKTRDDDDRQREAALGKDKEFHSVPEKKKPQPLQTPGAFDSFGDGHTMSAGIPSRSRQAVAQSPPLVERSESLASILSPRLTNATPFSDRTVLSAPKSPGLPMSPRPEDRPIGSPLPRMPREIPSSLASMPMSSSDGLAGLALTPRAAKHQYPFGPGNPVTTGTDSYPPLDYDNQPIPSIDAAVQIDSPRSPNITNGGIYQGLVSDDHPNLLLPPNALPFIEVRVSSSRLRPSRNSYMASRPAEEEPVFTLSVFSRSENSELWRVEKVIAALPQLDQQMRQLSSFAGKLPDKAMFSGHSPAKVDARRAALNCYFEALLDTPMDEKAALIICQFLTCDAIEPRDDETSLLKSNNQVKSEILRGPDGKPRKEGYLTKRGKNFGGWKARYFILHGPELKYFESPGGPHLGTIKLYSAQIGKQSQNTNAQSNSPSRGEDDSDNQYRHAFLILEPKKKDSSALVRHVLCAESDEERDAWVEALLEYVEGHSSESEGFNIIPSANQPQATGKQATSSNPKSRFFTNGSKRNGKGVESPELDGPETVQGFSFDDAVPAEPPVLGASFDRQPPKSPQIPPGILTDSADPNQAAGNTDFGHLTSHPSKVISGPTNGAKIQDAGAWGNKAAASNPTSTKEKKRSIWGFRTRSSFDLASQLQASHEASMTQAQSSTPIDRNFVRPVFGIPLAEAVHFCPPQGVDADLPAVVYRCIEYLEAKGAALEEGIFRLSGSNVVVKALKERFNTEGDVDFLAGDQYYDVHAVASLFKQYLRELPSTVLTRELHLEFLRVLELGERHKKIAAFNVLVHRLPKSNLALLRALAQFLIVIVNNSDINKMTVRNVGIVFAPTLNIPAPVFSMFLTDFDSIFGVSPRHSLEGTEVAADRFVSSEDARSPRHQRFSDIPTPGPHQTTFRRQEDFPDTVPEEYPTQSNTGFTVMQPSYEQLSYIPENYNQSQPSSPSVNRMLTPNFENSRSAKAKRRESSLLFMEANYQNTSIPTSREDHGFGN